MMKHKAVSSLIVGVIGMFINCIGFKFVEGDYGNAHYISYPERIDGRQERRDLSTSEKGGHVDDASYRLSAFDKDWILDIKKNKVLVSPSFSTRTFASDGSEIIKKGVSNHCHYQGTIRGMKDSVVILNTCSGLRGMIDDGKDSFYIKPETGHQDSGAHKVFLANEEDSGHICASTGNDEADVQDDSHPLKESSMRRIVSNVDEFYKPYLTTDETRYNELIMAVDFRMYQAYKDSAVVEERVLALVNAVDTIYQRINIRVVLKELEIWTNGDPYERNSTAGRDLARFCNYRKKNWMKRIPHDNAQLLSGWRFGVGGMAWVRGMCRDNSCGINRWKYIDIIGPYVAVAHEMGHNFGFHHDQGRCKCLTPRGCIMGGHKTRVPGFSNCSLESLKKINDWCLYNVPTYKAVNGFCGNGIREEGEECDCGTPEICMAKDPCCEPHNCVLKREAQCSDLHHTCCKNCLLKKQGSLCREIKTDCDVPEYCPGDSRHCPEDTFIINGYSCNQTNTVVQGNTDTKTTETRKLNPNINTRYLRINPQYWHGKPCLRTDFLGCSSDEVSPTAQTPLKSYALKLCISPSNKTCSPSDNERLQYATGGLCRERHLQFTLGSDGLLRHSCSGKMVCPENGLTKNGAKIVISGTCTVEDSTFERTPGRSLKHVKSGKCIHSPRGWPAVGKNLILWRGCNDIKNEIWFTKQDCVEPLGMESGEIKDSQITASSSSSDHLPIYGRLTSNNYWCAGNKNKKEYLQVDLGQVKRVNKISIQGTGKTKIWVTGFFLYFSDDGQRWTAYTESGDKTHSNSVCYFGKCSEIHETQCKDLWGATAKNADNGCYDKLNKEAAGYGTCDPATNTSCDARDVLCGQLQCEDNKMAPSETDYGWTYTKIPLDNGKQCSGATLKHDDELGLGMVEDGTKCGTNKMCVNYKCQSFDELKFGKCPKVHNIECGGRGICTDKNTCHCEDGFDPKDGCASLLVPRDGIWSEWTSWSECDKACDGGKRNRHRFCNKPFPLHGGADCPGDRHETEDCNTESCPVVISCRHLQQIGEETNHNYTDGVYKIYPTGSQPIKTYCDMSRDGGGWTLLVASHTNTWTAENVKLRNANSPKLNDDYSILQYADSIKDNINVAGSKFEYRLEAQTLGRWGGIWEAPRGYTFLAQNEKQTDVTLIKRFDNWKYSYGGIAKRMPWISGARLTTSKGAGSNWWGSITGNDVKYYPAKWISGRLQEKQPSYIWYWMREGSYQNPSSY